MKTSISIAMRLMEALEMSRDTGDYFYIADDIKRAVRKLKLPVMYCNECMEEIDFCEYYEQQGFCDKCTLKLQQKYRGVYDERG
jgi:hypothetical protein